MDKCHQIISCPLLHRKRVIQTPVLSIFLLCGSPTQISSWPYLRYLLVLRMSPLTVGTPVTRRRPPHSPPDVRFSRIRFIGCTCFRDNVELRGRGLYARNLSMVKIYVKVETFESRSVAPDPLERFVSRFFIIQIGQNEFPFFQKLFHFL